MSVNVRGGAQLLPTAQLLLYPAVTPKPRDLETFTGNTINDREERAFQIDSRICGGRNMAAMGNSCAPDVRVFRRNRTQKEWG